MRACRAGRFGIAGAVLVVVLGGCGSGDDREDTADTAASAGARSDAGSGNASAAAGGNCPLTAAEVGDVVGVAVRQDATSCMFEPSPGNDPRVLYVRQVPIACSDAVVNDPSFTLEPHEGLGVRAYAGAAGGDLLVCTNPPFEITVNITPELADVVADADAASAAARASERAAAEELARLILTR